MREVREQPSKLRSFLSVPVVRATSGSIFVGAGDSYAAALATFYLSGGKYLAFDPYAIAPNSSFSAGRGVFFLFFFRRNRSNVSAAPEARRVGGMRNLTTPEPGSPPAEEG